jgi:cation transport ATPase
MKNKQKIYKRILCIGGLLGLGGMTAVLFLAEGKGGFQYYVTLGVLSISWFILLGYCFELSFLFNLKALPSGLDKIVILSILIIFFLLILAIFINSLIQLNFMTSLLFGIFLLGLWNVINDFGSQKRGKANKKRQS